MARKVKNVIRETCMGTKEHCSVCLSYFQLNLVEVVIVEEDGDEETTLCLVCPDCLRGGVERMLGAIEKRRRSLDELEVLIQDVEHWVSVEQLEQVEHRREEEVMKLWKPELETV